jgi:hypothetical protein
MARPLGRLRRRAKPLRRFALHPAAPARGIVALAAVAGLVLRRLGARQGRH